MAYSPKILIVDDEPFNIDYLEQELEDLGLITVSASNGQEALRQVAAEAPDLILLDIMMPHMDGFEVLTHLQADKRWRDIPVIVISAMNDISSIAKGIQLGADDYLPKPFDPILLHARLSAGLERKRLRDQEIEYLQQVEALTIAARAIEINQFDPSTLDDVEKREDALGNLARVFQRMAGEVHAREQRLQLQLEKLRLDQQEFAQAASETAVVYLPMDRRHVLASGNDLADRCQGAALFADISGFTPLTATLARELGLERGAEELVRLLNQVYGALIDEVHRHGGTVVNFSGDAITCWFDTSRLEKSAEGLAIASALAMHKAISTISDSSTVSGISLSFSIKATVVSGQARRFLVGDPKVRKIEVLAGDLLDELATGDGLASRGEVLVGKSILNQLGDRVKVQSFRSDSKTNREFAVISSYAGDELSFPWPQLPANSIPLLRASQWLLPPVFETVRRGNSQFLSELRTVTSLFLGFEGIDYDNDDAAGEKLDAFIVWVQNVVASYEGHLIQLTTGDKGNYLYVTFGAPVAMNNDNSQAVIAALVLQNAQAEFSFINNVQIGITSGQMRVGTYGSPSRRTYGVMGEKANLAARLMEAASGSIYCDRSVYEGARNKIEFIPKPSLNLKGIPDPVEVFSPSGKTADANQDKRLEWTADRPMREAIKYKLNQLPPASMQALKVASVIGTLFSLKMLQDVYPDKKDRQHLAQYLEPPERMGLIIPLASTKEPGYAFRDALTQETAYDLMLFSQRRQIHRAIAKWLEKKYDGKLSPHLAVLSHHWARAEDTAKAIEYMELAGEESRRSGDIRGARSFIEEALALEKNSAVLGEQFRDSDPDQK